MHLSWRLVRFGVSSNCAFDLVGILFWFFLRPSKSVSPSFTGTYFADDLSGAIQSSAAGPLCCECSSDYPNLDAYLVGSLGFDWFGK